jgi:hypothetical protein
MKSKRGSKERCSEERGLRVQCHIPLPGSSSLPHKHLRSAPTPASMEFSYDYYLSDGHTGKPHAPICTPFLIKRGAALLIRKPAKPGICKMLEITIARLSLARMPQWLLFDTKWGELRDSVVSHADVNPPQCRDLYNDQ